LPSLATMGTPCTIGTPRTAIDASRRGPISGSGPFPRVSVLESEDEQISRLRLADLRDDLGAMLA
jgi:hypothetical protein